jgi:UDP-glucose 4-epimerase
MKTLILGNGLIAKAMARKMVLVNQDVTIVSRNIDDKIDKVNYRQYQFEEIVTNKDLFKDVDNVIHTISTTTPANSMINIYQDAFENVLLNIKLMGLLSELKIKKFIFLSSGGSIYGHPVETVVHEGHPTDPISAYGVAKLSVEKYLHLYGYHYGLNYLILRPSNVYGYKKSVNKPQGVINHLLDCAINEKQFKLWGSIENCKDYLYINDFVEGLLLALNHSDPYKSRIYNISFGKTHSLAEIVEIIERKMGKKIDIEQVGETKFDVKNINVDSTLFKKDFNWKPELDIEAGISQIIGQFS